MPLEGLELLRQLIEAPTPVGSEHRAARIWRQAAANFADRVWSDTLGNSVAQLGSRCMPRILLSGHIDEIGLMITHIDDSGFLSFRCMGAWEPDVLVGQRVRILTKESTIVGAIGRRAHAAVPEEQRGKPVRIRDLWIDLGVGNAEAAHALVSVGDAAVIDYGFERVQGNRLLGRGLDDRVGAFIVLEALRRIAAQKPDATVFAVASSQEEIGMRGIAPCAYSLDPQVGIAVDVGQATDVPGADASGMGFGECTLGGGPQILRGPNTTPWLFALVECVAEEHHIPIQREAYGGATPTQTPEPCTSPEKVS